MDNKEFKPYISADKIIPEFTVTSVILGILLAVIFGAANAYLGVRVGMTVSASIPAAVISMGVIRCVLKKDSVLENNMVQTIGSAGESVAAGAVFTVPALFMWSEEWGTAAPSLIEISIIALIGGVLGILFMVPLRKALIVKEHGVLPYPEGTACAEVLLAGEEGSNKAGSVFIGLGLSAAFKFLADGIKLFPSEIDYEFKQYKGAGAGVDVLPALVGVGFICGFKISAYMLAGGILGWFVLMPLISLFGGDAVIYPAAKAISALGPWDLWKNYIKYIGAGAVAAGGIMSLIKSLPLIIDTFRKALKDLSSAGSGTNEERTNQDLNLKWILVAIATIAVIMWLLPVIPLNLFSSFIVVIFGFFFASVSARLVGLVGSSNNPVSGMTIATVLVSSILLKMTGQTGRGGMISAIAIGSVICIITAIAGDTSQDLKTGYILGSTPKRQQIGELIGVFAAAITIGGVLFLLNKAWGFDSKQLPAPQATLMKTIVEGVMNGNLQWNLVFAGAGIAVAVELIGIPVLPFAVGLYLPVHLSAGIMAGGLVRLYFEKKKKITEEKRKDAIDRGILYTSGMIAGEGLVGIMLAVCAIIPVGKGTFADVIGKFSETIYLGNIGGWIFFGLLIFSLFYFCLWKEDKKEA